MQSAISKLEAERAELDTVLSSGVFGRTTNHARLLTFVCEKYFEGAIDEIKEYNIAVHALGRPESFDPQVDTIVRVTAHALRKRLEDYYRSSGAEHHVQICLPPGHYVPKFVHRNEVESENNGLRLDESQGDRPASDVHSQEDRPFKPSQRNLDLPAAGSTLTGNRQGGGDDQIARNPKPSIGLAKTAFPAFLAVVLLSLFAWNKWNRTNTSGNSGDSRALATASAMSISGGTLRAMAADALAPYTDHSGFTWENNHFCSGGSAFSVTGRTIQGTEDQQLFSNGRRGTFTCKYPVPPGTYEVHLLFAETSGLQENSGNFAFSINEGPANNLDVVDDAGGDDIATAKTFTDVTPENDGMIHLNFNTPQAFLNAVEILPGTPHRMLPVRIVVGHSSYLDSNGNVWVSERDFFGGRLSSFGGDLSRVPDGRLYEWHRFGHFHYVVPVAPGGKYTLKLYFLEHWFGVQNGGIGGVGSRVFDVSCNGSMLLKGFDIFREAGSQQLVKTFPHIEPTPQGKIEIYFTPAVNYASISAIEVLPE